MNTYIILNCINSKKNRYRHLFTAAVMQVLEFTGLGRLEFPSNEGEKEFKLAVDDEVLSL